MLWYANFESIVSVQREFRRECGERPLDKKSLRRWYNKFREAGDLKREILLGGLGDPMEMWFVLDRFPCGV